VSGLFVQGSMLWSQFSAIFPNFRQKWRLSQIPMLWSNIFQNLALFRVKNVNFFAKLFCENILIIITSVPVRVVRVNYKF
jgi:hypothetical protein